MPPCIFFKLLVRLLKYLFDHLCGADLGVTFPRHMQIIIQSLHFGDRWLCVLEAPAARYFKWFITFTVAIQIARGVELA